MKICVRWMIVALCLSGCASSDVGDQTEPDHIAAVPAAPKKEKTYTFVLSVEREKVERLGFDFTQMEDHFAALLPLKDMYHSYVIENSLVIEMQVTPEQLKRIIHSTLTLESGAVVIMKDLCEIRLKE